MKAMKTTVKYTKKDKVIITMDMEHYEKLCDGYNKLLTKIQITPAKQLRFDSVARQGSSQWVGMSSIRINYW